MLKFTTEVKIKGVTGSEIGNFMLNCTDEKYQKWWPNTHLVFNTTMHNPDYAGNKIIMDEYVGKRRLLFKGIVVENNEGQRVVW